MEQILNIHTNINELTEPIQLSNEGENAITNNKFIISEKLFDENKLDEPIKNLMEAYINLFLTTSPYQQTFNFPKFQENCLLTVIECIEHEIVGPTSCNNLRRGLTICGEVPQTKPHSIAS